LNCATMCPIGSKLLAGGRLIAHVLLIETERDGLILVDTGFGTRDIDGKSGIPAMFQRVGRPALAPGGTAIAPIELLGLSPADVRHVVVTHLDLDHAGGISDFPDAKIHLHAREHAAALAPATVKERHRYLRAHWAHGPKWEVYTEDGDTWRGLPA